MSSAENKHLNEIKPRLFFNEEAVKRTLVLVSPEDEFKVMLLSKRVLLDYYNKSILPNKDKRLLYTINFCRTVGELN